MVKAKERSVNVSGKPKHSLDVNRDAGNKNKSGGSGRSAATVRRLKMYNTRPKRDAKGTILKHDLQSKELPSTRIQPDRRWFGNTRVVNQKELEFFRQELQSRLSSNYNVILKERKLPMSLLNDHQKMHLKKNVAVLIMGLEIRLTSNSPSNSLAFLRSKKFRLGKVQQSPGCSESKQQENAMAELGRLLMYEASRDCLPTMSGEIQSPLGVASVEFIDPREAVAIVPILRAGLALAEHASSILPATKTYHLGQS